MDVVAAYPRRGEVWIGEFDPTVGSEIRKTRPCLVISPDSMNQGLRTVVVMPLTSGSRPAPFRIALTFAGREALLLGDQVRTFDRRRLHKRIGTVDQATLTAVLGVLRDMFAD